MRLVEGIRLFDNEEARQLESGIVVPYWLGEESGLEHRPYDLGKQYECYDRTGFL